MKNSKRTYRLLTLCFLLFGISLFLSNCDNSENIEVEQITSPKLSGSLLRGTKLLDENNIVSEQIKKLTGQIKLGRGIDVPEYGFSIDTTSVLKLVGDDFESFTFQIFRDNPEHGILENYVLTTYPDSTFTQFIAKYNELAEGIYDANNPEVTIINDDSLLLRENDCQTAEFVTSEWVETCVYTTCSAGDNHAYGDEECSHWGTDSPYRAMEWCSGSWVTTPRCGGGSGDDNSTNYNDNSNSNTGSTTGATSGSTGTSNTGTTTNTTATTAHISHSIFNDLNFGSFILTLNTEQQSWIRNISNYNEADAIYDFLATNSWSSNSESLASKIINILRGNLSSNSLTNSFENQSFIKIVGSSLQGQNGGIFKNFSLAFDNLNEFNNLLLSDWHLLSTKANDIYNVTDSYSNISLLTDITELSIAHQQIVIQNTYFIGIFPSLKSMGIDIPNTAEEWKAFFAIIQPILIEIGIEFIPLGGAYNSMVDTLDGISAGDWTAVTIGVVGIIIEFTPLDQIKNLYKLIKHSKKGIKIFKLTRKFTNVIRSALDAGLEIVLEGTAVIFKKTGAEVARIVNNVMTFKYSGFGNDIITDPNKTTTVIGKFDDLVDGGGTSSIINSGLSKSGQNTGGINALSFDGSGMTPAQQWIENQNWLDDAINRLDDIIRVISNPLKKVNIFKQGFNLNSIPDSVFNNGQALSDYLLNLSPAEANNLSFFGKEVRHLFQNGYTYDAITNQFIL